jgi:putative ubiquitin-RnfH superfamily antitoxin RatB of RatAB toxin-antitoxin module
VELDVANGTTLLQAVKQSSLAEGQAPIRQLKAGIFGEVLPLDTRLHDGDRVEIYRELLIGPKEARRLREKAKKR